MDRLRNKEVWLVGKGPSLDSYDWSKAGPYRIGINEAAFSIPKCWGAIATDYNALDMYMKYLSKDIIVFKKSTHVDYTFPLMYIWVKGIEVTNPCSTSPTAIQILHYLGVSKIHFVGFDSIDCNYGVANVQHQLNETNPRAAEVYSRIAAQVMSTINELGVTAIWEHRHV